MNISSASQQHQRLIIAFLIFVVTVFFLRNFQTFQAVILIPLLAFSTYSCAMLAKALGKSAVLGGVVGFFGFFILWIPQLFLVNFANKVFKAHGLKVGFLGGATRPL